MTRVALVTGAAGGIGAAISAPSRRATEPVLAGFRLRPDSGARVLAGGTLLAGGSPVRVLRLTPAGARQVAVWWGGATVPGDAGARALARRLLDAGIAHPALGGGPVPAVADDPAARCAPGGTGPGAGGIGPGAPCGFGPADVTVVIPVLGRAAELARCLGGLSRPAAAAAGHGEGAPDCPEVIVVDDGSSAADAAAIAHVAAGAGARLVRRPANGGPGAARNTGLAATGTPLVAFLDSDCVPRPGGWTGCCRTSLTPRPARSRRASSRTSRAGRGWRATRAPAPRSTGRARQHRPAGFPGPVRSRPVPGQAAVAWRLAARLAAGGTLAAGRWAARCPAPGGRWPSRRHSRRGGSGCRSRP